MSTAVMGRRRPSFLGAVGGEVVKLRGQRSIWAILGLSILFFALLSLALLSTDRLKHDLTADPAGFLFSLMDIYLAIFETGCGILLLLVSARLVGMEYSGGTIRVLLARGGGRLRILLAKLAALAILGVAVLAGYLLLVGATVLLAVHASTGNLNALSNFPPAVWTDIAINGGLALVSIGAAILIGATAAVLGRSLAFAIGAALAFYPADNVIPVLARLMHAVTGWQFWPDMTTLLLGPNLNALPPLLQTDHHARAAFQVPLEPVTAAHAWLVIGAWLGAMLVLSAVLTRLRDVQQ